MVRARRVPGSRATTPSSSSGRSSPTTSPAELRRSPNFGVEVDAMPGGYVCSGSMKATARHRPTSARAGPGQRPIRKLFTKEQRAFFDDHAPEGIELDDLALLGPIFVLKLKFAPRGLRPARWSPRCGSTRTGPASWSCRPSARRARRSRSPPSTRVPHHPGHRRQRRAADQDPTALEYFAEHLES